MVEVGITIGSLFTGYGGIDLGLKSIYPSAETVFTSDIDPGAKKIIGRRFPDAPNLGDITDINWAKQPKPTILTGGFPCQDVSSAGLRRGLKTGTRSGLWAHMAEAIDALQPQLVIIENVAGLLSATSERSHHDIDVQPCPLCVGDSRETTMRALGTVLADLAEIGFDAQWGSYRASDVGAPHRRERVFIAAYPQGHRWGSNPGERQPFTRQTPTVKLLRTPTTGDGVRAHGEYQGPREYLSIDKQLTRERQLRRGQGPTASRRASTGNLREDIMEIPDQANFGQYTEAVERWAAVIGRQPPPPWEGSKAGKPQLAPVFVEWLMGLPPGWVTGTGISRTAQIKALGNGVVPQQAAAAVKDLLAGW